MSFMGVSRALCLLIDFVYPPRCPLCDSFVETDGRLCADCTNSVQVLDGEAYLPHLNRNWFDSCRARFAYEGRVREGICAFKFKGRLDLANFFGDALAHGAYGASDFDAIVPVPMHPARLRSRGFNPAALLALAVGRRMKIAVYLGMLRRARNAKPQVGLEREARLANARGSFSVDGRHLVHPAGKRILIVDDILTTGATVNECARTLLKAKARSISILTVARTL